MSNEEIGATGMEDMDRIWTKNHIITVTVKGDVLAIV